MTRSSPPMKSELPEFLGGTVDDRVEVRPRLPNERPGHIPGEAGLWIFLLGDMTLFAAILLAFLWKRRSDPLGFKDAAHQLIQPIGAVNTLVLLLSSYLVVRALFAHRAARYLDARRLITGAIGCAVIFAGLKAIEYYARDLCRPHTGVGGVLQLLLRSHWIAPVARHRRNGTSHGMAGHVQTSASMGRHTAGRRRNRVLLAHGRPAVGGDLALVYLVSAE